MSGTPPQSNQGFGQSVPNQYGLGQNNLGQNSLGQYGQSWQSQNQFGQGGGQSGASQFAPRFGQQSSYENGGGSNWDPNGHGDWGSGGGDPWGGFGNNGPKPPPAAPFDPLGNNFGALTGNPNDAFNRYRQQLLGSNSNGTNMFKDMLNKLGLSQYPRALAAMQFGNSLEPGREANIQNMINMFSPQSLQNNVDTLRGQALGNAQAQTQRLQQQLQGTYGTAGIGAMQGAGIDAINQANRQANDLQSSYASPQGRQQIASLLQGLYGQGQDTSALGPLQSLMSSFSSQPQPQPSQSFLGSIAPIIGGLLPLIPGL